MKRQTAALLAALFLTACGAPTAGVPTMPKAGVQAQPAATGFSVVAPNAPSGPVVDNFARRFLNSIQAQSIRDRSEYCGYIRLSATGQLEATQPIRGTFAGCEMPAPRAGQGIIASYHTHGAFDQGYDNEVPSTLDLRSDFQFGMDGYVSTPGGRVWLVDVQTRTTRQLCGRGCVISDPLYQDTGDASIRPAYTLPDLQRRQGVF
ncbi:DUF4329 domain-containing protein [Pseudooctadecabacter jejudonensis]|uniref:DUF4329 domain-containing protein n=1 Tax=Pseudooctadecabacter jejudonensis TaxID=1391910 RepID=A0A1Y5RAG4_9RHOB|nr:DUF4329 domain-containing protein [Pseudooctadecabacter jejudonensis]SLN12180.1 hypothetical protein PSJ8397_00153 [Pseudooctadecabacter jejudonensis]